MTIAEFLRQMQLKGVDLSIRGDQLHFRAPAGVMTPSLRQELAARKEELLLYLRDAGLRQEPSVEANRDRRAPLSFAQERIWFLVQLNPESPFYNVAWAITLVGRLDVEALRHSLQHVVRRHDVFRTVCTTIEDERVQLVTTDKDVEFEMLDLRRVPQAKRKGSAARLVREKARRTFDLSTDVLLRATLLRLQEQEFILLLTTHHFATDGWSVRFLLMREVSELYAYAASGVTPSLPELPIQYADFATWQRRTARNLFHDQLQYWMGSLDGAPDLLLLPACRRRPDIQTYRGRAEFLSLPKTLSDRLRAFSRSERVTPFMTLLAAFQTLLYRYTGTDDIVVGTVTSNRNLKEIEQSIGPFANNLVLRTDFSGLPTFRQLLARVRENTVAAYAHQDVPFELVVQHIFPRRDLGRHPIFQVAFVCHDSLPEGNLKLQGLDVKGVRIGTGTARFDLAVEVSVGEAEMSGFVEYSSDLFDSATIKRLLAHYRRILESIVTDPDQSVSKLPLMTKSERRKLLSRSSLQLTNQSPGTQKRTVVALFEEQVQRTPDATVLSFVDRGLSYRELNLLANQFAQRLTGVGVRPDVPVGICLERSLKMVVGLLGILKAGGAYVPMDPRYPESRLRFMAEDAGVSVLVTESPARGKFRKYKGKLIDLTDGELEVRSHLPNPNARFTLDNLAYVTYTSGSTGQSKGVAVEHRGVSALLYWAKEVFGADDRAGVLASTSISFDLSIFELLLPLCWGGRAILVRDIMDLPCESAEVTLLNTVPSAAAQLAKVDGLPHSIRTVNLAGEPLSAALAQELYSRPHVKRVFNLYGPAESTVYSTFALVPKEAVTQPPIGCPIANARILILDRHLEPIPEGVAGELCIAGEGLARGYLNRPDLTAERFIQHSFGQKPEARLYRTGDLARYRRDGQIEYVGRMDRQLKIRGFRIEPGEIERALEEHADVQRAVVASANTNLGPLELVAYLLVRNDRLPGLSEIRNWLNAKLPSAMIPSRFLIVERFPLSPNGKIDLETLLREGGTVLKSRIQQGYGEWNNLERSIGHIWGKLLACDDFSAEDNFFDVGGHSLLLLDVQHELRKVDQHVSVVELFQNPTIRSLARHLSKGDRGLSSPDESRERARKRRGAYTAKRLQGSAR